MPIIGNVGRRSVRVRFLNVAIHTLLILGSVTMVYPFLMMLSGSVKSKVDSAQLTAIPSYFYDQDMLYKKWIESKYNEGVGTFAISYRNRPYTFLDVEPTRNPKIQRYNDWNEFLDGLDNKTLDFYRCLGHSWGVGTNPEMRRTFIRQLKAEPDVQGDIALLNDKYQTTFPEWAVINAPTLDFLTRESSGTRTAFMDRILDFGNEQDRDDFCYFSLDSLWVEVVLRPEYARVEDMNARIGTSYPSWSAVRIPRRVPDGPLRDHWIYFVRERVNLQYVDVSEEARPAYQNFLQERYDTITLLNERYEANYSDFSEVPLLHDSPEGGVILADWASFITEIVDVNYLSVEGLDSMYRRFLAEKYGDMETLISAHELGLRDFADLALTENIPQDNLAYAADWAAFARENIGSGWVGPDSGARRDWINFLTKPYTSEDESEGEKVDIQALNADMGTDYSDVDKISIPLNQPSQPELANRWMEFLRDVCPDQLLRVNVEQGTQAWGVFIGAKYPDLREINRAYQLLPATFDEVAMPMADIDWFTFLKKKRHAFWEFFKRNYAVVFQMMAGNGRAILNTWIYCTLAIAAALLVNPLAAYALSRYKPPSQYKLLLLLMLTMAFPPMVQGIPNFLLLRKLNLLNTFAALILPGMANGYLIFILKGFFDALPRELYESAQIDGASEWTMFWHITMATSKPILAVIALGAFTMAYGNFMLAFIVCQDKNMWTMMVHIYQLQGSASQGVTFASLVIAAIPTLLVFIFCQNIIIRGIVVPTEK